MAYCLVFGEQDDNCTYILSISYCTDKERLINLLKEYPDIKEFSKSLGVGIEKIQNTINNEFIKFMVEKQFVFYDNYEYGSGRYFKFIIIKKIRLEDANNMLNFKRVRLFYNQNQDIKSWIEDHVCYENEDSNDNGMNKSVGMIKRSYTCDEQKLLRMNVKDRSEFFLAEFSCDPGGIREHKNICLNDYANAIKFAKNNSCYCVFCYGWNMYVWHYKIINKKAVLMKEINLNDYVIGAINENDEFVQAKTMREIFDGGCWNADEKGIHKYKKVVYESIPNITINNPISEKDIIDVNVPDEDNPDKEYKEHKFMLNYGYQWEGTDELLRYDFIDDNFINS